MSHRRRSDRSTRRRGRTAYRSEARCVCGPAVDDGRNRNSSSARQGILLSLAAGKSHSPREPAAGVYLALDCDCWAACSSPTSILLTSRHDGEGAVPCRFDCLVQRVLVAGRPEQLRSSRSTAWASPRSSRPGHSAPRPGRGAAELIPDNARSDTCIPLRVSSEALPPSWRLTWHRRPVGFDVDGPGDAHQPTWRLRLT